MHELCLEEVFSDTELPVYRVLGNPKALVRHKEGRSYSELGYSELGQSVVYTVA
jgi:hypothetical protein